MGNNLECMALPHHFLCVCKISKPPPVCILSQAESPYLCFQRVLAPGALDNERLTSQQAHAAFGRCLLFAEMVVSKLWARQMLFAIGFQKQRLKE